MKKRIVVFLKYEVLGIPVWAWLVLIGIIASWLFTPTIAEKIACGFGDGDVGKFGDLFGSVNALFSGIALWGVIVTLILQSRELRQNTDQITKTAAAMEKQQGLSNKIAQLNSIKALIEYENGVLEQHIPEELRELVPLKSQSECVYLLEMLPNWRHDMISRMRGLEEGFVNADGSEAPSVADHVAGWDFKVGYLSDVVSGVKDYFGQLRDLHAEIVGVSRYELVDADPDDNLHRDDAMCDQAEEECERGEGEEEK